MIGGLDHRLSVIICDRTIESLLFADYELLDRMKIHSGKLSVRIGDTVDGKNLIGLLAQHLRPGEKYDKTVHGRALSRTMRFSEDVLARSRSLRKLRKELA